MTAVPDASAAVEVVVHRTYARAVTEVYAPRI